MSLSSGGWARALDHAPDQFADLPDHHEASQSQLGCQTVLMSVRVSVCHSGIRPLCLPGAGDESLRLQLGMDPGKSGEFRLSLQSSSGTGRSVVSLKGRGTSAACFDLCVLKSGSKLTKQLMENTTVQYSAAPVVYI